MESEKIIEPGAIKINSIILNSGDIELDVTNFVIKCEFHESIMSPIITGSLTMSDASSLDEVLIMTGEEFLRIDIETPGFEDDDSFRRNQIFFVYKMEGRENMNLKNVVYTLDFMSPEGIVDNQTKISKTFSGKPSTIANTILKTSIGLKTDKEVITEDTTSNVTYTSNFWTPFQNVYYLLDKSINIRNNPNFVFFENRVGFIFASLDALMSKTVTQHFVRDQHTRIIGIEDTDLEYRKILDMSTPELFDQIKRLDEGFYGGSIYDFDISNKKLTFTTKDATDYDQTMLNEISPMKFVFDPRGSLYHQTSHTTKYTMALPIDNSIKRMSLLKRLEHMKTNIQVHGRLDYTVGDTMSLMIYSDKMTDENDTDDDIINYVLSGNYLVTGIKHSFDMSHHTCSIELCKDSILEPLVV